MFKNISNWSNKKLNIIWISLIVAYFAITLIGPLCIICNNYDIFKSVQENSVKISGVGFITILCIAIIGLRTLKKVIVKLPQISLNQQRFKFTILGIYKLFIPVGVIIILLLFKSDFDLAYKTFRDSMWFIITGVIIDSFFISYLDAERDLRHEAQKKVEVDKRVGLYK